jgi:anti-sigma B factor antagonist
MRICERQFGDVVVLDLAGPLTGAKAAEAVDAAVRRNCRAGKRLAVANLGSVPSVDLAGLGALVDAFSTMRAAGGVLRLACLTQRIHDLVVITRLLTVFDTFDSVEEAVGGAVPAYAGVSDPQFSIMPLGAIQRFLRRA